MSAVMESSADELQAHEYANIFPMLSGDTLAELRDDITDNGLAEPIWLYEGKILDGRNRYRACLDAGVDFETREFEGDDPLAFVLSLNLHRRHLSESQRAMVAARIADIKNGGDRRSDQSASLHSGTSSADAAASLNVSERSVKTAKKVQRDATPDLAAKVDDGKVSVSAAADVATLPKEKQVEVVAKGEAAILAAAKEVRERKAAERREQNAEVAAIKMAPPTGTYSTIVIDPPWEMKKIARDVTPDQVDFDYPTMDSAELVEFGGIVNGAAAEHAHLFMWTTHKHLPLALDLLGEWDWKYVLTMVWHKNGGFQPFGLPQYNCEFCIYARKGSPEFRDFKAFPTCFQAPRREHSRKPDEFYDLIRRVTHEGRIDVFSRESRDGFAQYGNESEKFA